LQKKEFLGLFLMFLVVIHDVLDNDEVLYVKKNLDAQFVGKEMK